MTGETPARRPLLMRVRRALLWSATLGAAGLAVFTVWVYTVDFPAPMLDRTEFTSTAVTDHRGRLLRESLGHEARRARWLAHSELPADVILATIHAEDKRFHAHPGVDPAAIARSAYYNLRRQRLVTGASTITQQTVKLIMPRPRRDPVAKAMEAVWALRLEAALSKEEILAHYLNRAPYGHQRFGIEAAARLYFGKPARALSLAEATLLAGLPQAPTAHDPYRNLTGALARQRTLLAQMRQRGAISVGAYRRAVHEEIVLAPRRGVFRAPHFAEEALRRHGKDAGGEIRTTLHLDLQQKLEAIVNAQLTKVRDRDVSAAAVVVLDNRDSTVLAWVGSPDYFNKDILGANDGVLARRQPGSTLKPFVYQLYFENGGTPADMIADLPTEFPTQAGVYIPQNFSRTHLGPVSVRRALGNSLNVPVVAAASELGPKTIQDRLRALGMTTLDQSPAHYGLGIALGDGDVRLLDLAGAYAALARGGRYLPPSLIAQPSGQGTQVMEPAAVYQILEILADDGARAETFGRDSVLNLPYRVAVKTGTSTHYRDAWTVGVTPGHTVAVWTGNFNGAPTGRMTGSAAAGPIMRHVFQALYPDAAGQGDVAWFPPPGGVTKAEVCTFSGQPAGPDCPHKRLESMAQGRRGASSPPGEGARRQPGPAVCQMHVARCVDASGQDSPPPCRPGTTRVAQLDVPPAWRSWAYAQGLPLTNTPHGAAGASPRVAHPLAGDDFVLSAAAHDHTRSLSLRVYYHGNEPLTWFINGAPLAVVEPPYAALWKMTPGEHTIGVGRGQIEDEVHVQVR